MAGQKADRDQYEKGYYGAHRGGQCSVGEGVPAPYRLTIRLSEPQWKHLHAVALDMRKPVAETARRLLFYGAGLYWNNPEMPLEGMPAKRRKGKVVVVG